MATVTRAQFEALQAQVRQLEHEVDKLNVQHDEAVTTRVDPDASFVQDVSQHDYFDELINGLMVEGLSDSSSEKRQKLDGQKQYSKLSENYVPKILLENCYRLGGATAFPVNDPEGHDEQYMGIRFDVYDEYTRQFCEPHYVILKQNVKNSDWFVFKTTVPAFVPVSSLAYRFLNSDMQHFATEVRRHLVALVAKRGAFTRLREQLEESSCKLDPDLSYTKVTITLQDLFQVVLMCDLFTVANVTVVGDYRQSEGLLTPLLKKKIELSLKGMSVHDLPVKFLATLEKSGLPM